MRRLTNKAFKFGAFSLKQRKVIEWWMKGSPFRDYDGIIADGSIRSGKTIAMILGFVLWSVHCFKGENFILSGRSIGALKRNVVKPMLQILTARRISYNYNRSENYIEFGGNTYYLFGANNEASQDVLQGITAAGWLGDEVALQPQSFVEQAIGRCSIEGSKIWLNCNPESPKHYVYLELIKKARDKRLFHLHFLLDDNLTLSEKIKERYRRMFSGVWFDRFILGLWKAAQGAIYDMFDEKIHVVSDLPQMIKYWVSCDYGTSNPTVFLLIGLGVDRKYYVIDEWRWDSKEKHKQLSDAEYSQEYKKWIKSWGVTPLRVLVDPSAASFKVQLKKDGVQNVMNADNNVLDGIRRTSTMFKMLRLFIHIRCVTTRSEVPNYIWDPKAQLKGEDKPVKQNDHSPDCIRYFANHIKPKLARQSAVGGERKDVTNYKPR